MERWRGRVAIVTGASEGIGAAIAKRLALVGMKVVGVARHHQKIQEWGTELQKCEDGVKVEVHALHCDVSKAEDIRSVVEWTKQNLGAVHVLVNNAGVAPTANLHDGPIESIRSTFEVNTIGLTIFTREVVSCMRELGINDGHIFHINSVSGQFIAEEPGSYVYAGSKHAVRVMTEGLRRELRDLGTMIRVTNISPGNVRTNILLNNGVDEATNEKYYKDYPSMEPEEIARALEYALSTPQHVQVQELIIRCTGEPF